MSYLTITKQQGIAVVRMDQPGEKMNTLTPELLTEFSAMLDRLEKDSETLALVLISGKPDNFIAGANLEMLAKISEPGGIEALSRSGQAMLNRLADFRIPSVAAINGAALGGGLEVAMACRYRVCSDAPKTILGQPEVKLGLLPGAGGTQRLPRLVGLQKALDIMLTGKNVYPYSARKMGLVDLVTNEYALLDAAIQAARQLASQPRKESQNKKAFIDSFLESNPVTRRIVYNKARQMTQKQTRGNYPAPIKIIDCVEKGLENGFAAGLDAEAKAFEELAYSPQSKALTKLFFDMNSLKKNPLQAKVREIQQIAILGAGLMGSGIAQVSAQKGLPVLLKDVSQQSVGRGLKGIWKDLSGRVKKRALTGFERDQIMSRINGTTTYKGFSAANMVIEAVFEDLDIKHKVLAEAEKATAKDTIFASNTSSLPITQIAATAKRPRQVIGMHYFSPVSKMPLLEVINTEKTMQWVTATAVDIGIKQGKTVIVVNDGPGFYTTRILAPMLNEALLLLEEGGDIAHIDKVMKDFGFPVGPLTLIDEVGIDVGAHVAEVMGDLFQQRGVESTKVMANLTRDGYKGRKNGKGFYLYEKQDKNRPVNKKIYGYFGGDNRRKQDAVDIADRLVLVMLNEAAHCLAEKIVSEPRDGDIGAIMGLGFPPFLGGPFYYADHRGIDSVVARLKTLEDQHGVRFRAAQILRDYADQGKTFYGN